MVQQRASEGVSGEEGVFIIVSAHFSCVTPEINFHPRRTINLKIKLEKVVDYSAHRYGW